MAIPTGLKPADLGGEPEDLDCTPKFRIATIQWSKPKRWKPSDDAPIIGAQKKPGYLYAISWDHHKAKRRETIAYIGLTSKLDTRFDNHPTAAALIARKRSTFLSIGHIDFGHLKNVSAQTQRITEELEHLLIWAMRTDLENIQKIKGLPAWGTNGGSPWHVYNKGHRFAGRMPREIVYPWMLVKPGRDRSHKATP